MGQPQNWAQIIIRWLPFVLLTGVWVFLLTRRRAGTSKDVQPEAKAGDGVARAVGIVVIFVFFITLYWRKALSVPWTWTFDQVFAVGLSIVAIIGAVRWGRMWWLDGYPAVKARLALVGRGASLSSPHFKKVLLWAAVAVLVVFLFYLLQEHGLG